MSGRILVGVSSCLLGEPVRWDGGHRQDRYLCDVLGRFVEFVPVCPEAEAGMGIPREPVHLEGDLAAPRLVGNRSRTDWTARMRRSCRRRVRELARLGLSGYVLKSRSPSCGLERVEVAAPGGGGRPRRAGVGVFAAELRRRLPLLPVEEAERLGDPRLREHFIVRVFAHHRVHAFFAARPGRGEIVAFHAREKYLLLAHRTEGYRELGRLVARVGDFSPADFRDRYVRAYLDTLQHPATVRKHVNVLHHLLGYLRNSLGPAEREDILRAIDAYRAQEVPLIVPVTLLEHHLRIRQVTYLLDQEYLHPAPAELALRYHA
ncbi:MAG TPA: DUF523 and DUF1722 domain-containing protein [Candidatus Krumholzibacteria bacterium]|nr:DUF523 and DUF1722 domain-containing protein [Candidatus Krumholzibacteria bacterium]HPD72539.1 DUF523 and DUF1722 domain-containing protein [Candidatus Krumholzibacteria bacterium]HRY40529.1 DUF523 and DUF1722 domain-containing protein [Candidatus Krumholzibacteria bacterium]